MTEAPTEATLNPPPTALQLGRALLQIGLTGAGGGLVAHYLHILVEKRRWIDHAAFLEGLAICQIVPGPNMGNFAAFVGHRLAGLGGSVAALLAILAPGAILLMILGAVLESVGDVAEVHRVLKAVAAAGVGISVAAVAKVVPGTRGSRLVLPIALAAFLIVGVLRWPLIWAVLLIGPVALWANRPLAGR